MDTAGLIVNLLWAVGIKMQLNPVQLYKTTLYKFGMKKQGFITSALRLKVFNLRLKVGF